MKREKQQQWLKEEHAAEIKENLKNIKMRDCVKVDRYRLNVAQ